MEPVVVGKLGQDHAAQGELLEALRLALVARPPDLARARVLLAELDAGLTEHLRLEEAELFPWLLRHVPEQADLLDTLLAEHVEIQVAATALGLVLASGEALSVDAMRGADTFVALFRSHSALEQALVTRAVRARHERAGQA